MFRRHTVFHLALALAFSTGAALATPTLVVDSLTAAPGKVNYVITDGDVTDTNGVDGIISDTDGNAAPGEVLFTTSGGTFDGWRIVAGSGSINGESDADVTDSDFLMNLNNISVQSSGAGTMVIAWIVDFAGPILNAPVLQINANPSRNPGTMEFLVESATSAVGAPVQGVTDDLTAAGGYLLSPFSSFGPVAGAGVGTGWLTSVAAPTSPYSLALVTVITATAANQTFSFDFTVTGVPEPGFYGLLALALSGLFFFGFRRRNAGAEEASQ